MVLTNYSNAEKRYFARSREGWFHVLRQHEYSLMTENGVRLLKRGVPRPLNSQKTAILLVLVLLSPIFTPATGNASVGRDDFGVLEAMADALNKQRDSGESELANSSAEAILDAVAARGRPIGDGDALLATDGVLGNITMRESTPFEPSHPRPYVYLTDPSTHPEGWPNDLIETLFDLPSSLSDPLAIGINTYSLYVNYTARDDGPQYEAWDYGTFTGDLLSFDNFDITENGIELGNSEPGMNNIDLDGDGTADVAVGLTILGLGNQGEDWGIEYVTNPLNLDLIPETIWFRPNFQWKIKVLDHDKSMWDNMAHMEVSMVKAFAYDLTVGGSGESYAMVIDSRFTQPPNEFEVKVGLDNMTLAITETLEGGFASVVNLITGGDESALEVLSVSAPYSILVSNPDHNSENRQSDCDDSTGYYDSITDHGLESREHKCGYNVGIGYVHFSEPDSNQDREVDELGYLDVGLHPEEGSTVLPKEVDLVIRNDNAGDNSFDNIEIYCDTDSDLWFHYFEDRSNHFEEGGRLGNITDSRGWVRGLPSDSLPAEEIEAIFTMIGEAPGSLNLPGQEPNRLSLIISIKNFTADNSANTPDGTLIMDPSDERWNSLILIAGNDRIDRIEYKSTFQRHGYAQDSSSLEVVIEDLPEVVAVLGTFEIPSSNRIRVEFGTAPDLVSEILDNVVLSLVEIVLDIGTILNGLPEAIVGTAGESSGEILLYCYNQVKSSWANNRERVEETAGLVTAAISSSPQPIMIGRDHIIIAEDLDNVEVDGRYGVEDPLVPVGMSVSISDVSGFGYSYDQDTDTRTISLAGQSDEELIIGHLTHLNNTTEGDVRQFASISNRPTNLTVTQVDTTINYVSSGPINAITYSGEGDGQYNALRLKDLPTQFTLQLGDTLGMLAPEGVGAIEVQISNATTPVTMDGDHVRFFVDETTAEASMSLRISNITRVNLFPPDEPGARGRTGNSNFELVRTSSAPFNVILEDNSMRADEFLGLNGRAYFDPLPANLTFSLPTSEKSSILNVPEFGQQDGVLSLSFFLSGMIEFGTTVNDFTLESIVNLGDASDLNSNMTLGLDLITNEEFDLTLDFKKGKNLQKEPKWVHGISGEVFEATQLTYNYSRMPLFTESSRLIVNEAFEDWEINSSERESVINAFQWAGINESEILVDLLADGYISSREKLSIDSDKLEEEGIELSPRRSWQTRMWMPNLPSGRIQLTYDVVYENETPTFQLIQNLTNYKPARPILTVILNGLERVDSTLILDGLNTEMTRDVMLDMVVTTESELIIPRTTIEMTYDLGERVDTAQVIQNNHLRGIRTEMMLFDVPRSAELYSKIGDVLIADLVVPPEYRIGVNAADSLMLQQLIKVDDLWWPSTMFIRDVPGEMHLYAAPANNFDIHEVTAFQGMFEMQYSSNSDEMDLFIETKGKAQNARNGNLMLAENLPDVFTMSVTDDYDAEISASGNGVEKLYIRRTDSYVRDDLTLITSEVVGEDLKNANVKLIELGDYPIIIVDGITSGRVVATSNTQVMLGDWEIDARGVMLDAQFTGFIPTASSVGINGVVTDLSMISTLTGGNIETTHIMIGEPIGSMVATGIAMIW